MQDNAGEFKECLNCKTIIYRKDFKKTMPAHLQDNDGPFWNQKLYCSERCRKEYSKREDKNIKKECLHCKRVFCKRYQEAIKIWNKKKFCSASCRLEYYRLMVLGEQMGLDYEELKGVLMDYLKKKNGRI